jgi:hypothetical protein
MMPAAKTDYCAIKGGCWISREVRRMNKSAVLAAVLGALVVLLLAATAIAQEEPAAQGQDQPQTIYKKKTVYDFEDDTITGDLTKPDGEYIDARRKVKHQNLIRIREDFKEKVLGSVSKI